jgi:hypothetical protein
MAGTNSATFIAKQPITSGLLAGQVNDFHLIDLAGNRTAPLLSIKEMTRLKMIIDFAEGSVSFKDALPAHKWYVLPKTPTGLLFLPVTQKVNERHNFHTSFVADISVVSYVVVHVEEQPSTGDPDDDEDATEYIAEEVHIVEKQPEEEPLSREAELPLTQAALP